MFVVGCQPGFPNRIIIFRSDVSMVVELNFSLSFGRQHGSRTEF